MRRGEGGARGDFGAMRVVAIHADLPFQLAHLAIPVAAGSAMSPSLPIAISRAVATATQRWTFLQLYFVSVAGLEELEIFFVMAIEAVVITVMPAMGHDHIGMLFGHDDIEIGVKPQRGWLAFFVAGVTVEIR